MNLKRREFLRGALALAVAPSFPNVESIDWIIRIRTAYTDWSHTIKMMEDTDGTFYNVESIHLPLLHEEQVCNAEVIITGPKWKYYTLVMWREINNHVD
jgi:hypothetical protein